MPSVGEWPHTIHFRLYKNKTKQNNDQPSTKQLITAINIWMNYIFSRVQLHVIKLKVHILLTLRGKNFLSQTFKPCFKPQINYLQTNLESFKGTIVHFCCIVIPPKPLLAHCIQYISVFLLKCVCLHYPKYFQQCFNSEESAFLISDTVHVLHRLSMVSSPVSLGKRFYFF